MQRGAHFSRIAYLVSKHDSDMIDYFTTNSTWFTNQLPEGHLYNGKTLKIGSCRCDVLINQRQEKRKEIRKRYNLPEDTKLLMYCPTFRSGSQGTNRSVDKGEENFPDFVMLLSALKERFDGNWVILLRLHPQLTARHQAYVIRDELRSQMLDISKEDDMYEILVACDAFLSDYSASSWDAAVMQIPVFLFMKDYDDYISDRGDLVINPEEHFPCAKDDDLLYEAICNFDENAYRNNLSQYFDKVELLEDGHASERVVDFIDFSM